LSGSGLLASKMVLPFSLIDELGLGWLFIITVCACMTIEGVSNDGIWCSEAGTVGKDGGMLPGVTKS
jgi:hypothetical protein